MAREVVTVCLTPFGSTGVRQAVAEAMAPFDHNGEGEEPQPCQWDAWWLGAAGLEFWIKPGFEGDPRLIREHESARPGSIHAIPPGRCTGGPVGLLEIEGQRSRAAEEAHALWHAWEEFASAYPAARSLEDLIAGEPGASIRHPGKAWQQYTAQPLVRALLDDPVLCARVGRRAVGDFGVGREAFLRRKANSSLAHDGLLTLDGTWMSPDSQPDHAYAEVVNRYIDALPPDTVLVNVKYHS